MSRESLAIKHRVPVLETALTTFGIAYPKRGVCMNAQHPYFNRLTHVMVIAGSLLALITLMTLTSPTTPAFADGGSTGADGPLVVTQTTTYVDPARYAVTDTLVAGSSLITLSATSAITDIGAGDEVLIINIDDLDGGNHEMAFVSQVAGVVLTLTTPLTRSYDGTTDKIVVQRVPNYTTVTVENGGTLTAHAWDGSTGGLVVLRAQTMTVESGGVVTADGQGYDAAGDRGPGGGVDRLGVRYSYGGGGGHGGDGGTTMVLGDKPTVLFTRPLSWGVPEGMERGIMGTISAVMGEELSILSSVIP